MLPVPVTDDVLAEAEEDVDGNAKELVLALIGMGTADTGSGSSSLGFAAAGGSLALGRTACPKRRPSGIIFFSHHNKKPSDEDHWILGTVSSNFLATRGRKRHLLETTRKFGENTLPLVKSKDASPGDPSSSAGDALSTRAAHSTQITEAAKDFAFMSDPNERWWDCPKKQQ
ncbi:hypothetical protein AVEN_15574-1 [Araneus ventricosus]|uniref:Uncharacterized protein n=1 Tax=Araneus ventricosus TaxID=182803 RepID=A0A4Y2WWM0_ARAVE|nr:hypothetical protein AVEN_15574-1 [Araneus ventricosus]